ncbi:hypothetical protein [Sphingomonas albertensis]|uniref:hypothetical protein n=1 Tax=Sphingomonas albertensis TaxID=2762591 RepID=UPI0037D9A0E9
MAATGQLKERIQLLQAAKARAESLGKTLKPEVQKELDSYSTQGLLGSSAAGAAGGKVTEGERKTAFLATRLAGSLDQLNDVPADQQKPGWFQEAVRGVAPEAIANSVTGSDRQRVEAAQADILDAALTLGTGAAYTKEQLNGYRKSYFPQLGDSDEVIKDKTKRLNTLLQSARIGAGGAAPQIDEALKKSGFAVPGAPEAKGGDPKSGTAGAAVAAGDQPPAGPTPPSGPDSRGEVQFNGEGPQLAAGVSKLSPEAQEKLYQFSLTKPNAAQLKQYYDTLGAGVLPDDNAQQIADYYAKGGTERIGVSYDKAEVTPIDAGDGAVGAAARGAGNALTLGFLDEAGALADTVTQGGTYGQNLDRRRGQELFDEQNNGGSRFAGQMVGSLPLGGIEFAGARAASRAAGVAAIRQGLGREVAVMQANRTFAMRSAMEGAGIGAVYGAGEAEGGLGDRAVGAAGGAAFGGAAAGALSLGGGALLARRAAAARAAGRAEPSEAAQLARTASEQNIELLPQDVASGPGIGRATAGAAQTPFGANTVKERATKTYESFRDRVGALAGGPARTLNDVGAPIKENSARLAAREGQRANETSGAIVRQLGEGSDITGAGQLIQRGATKWLRDTQEKAGQLYDQISIPSSFDAKLDATRGALKDLTEGFKSNKALSSLWAENPRLKATLEAITPERGDPTDLNPEGELIGGTVAWGDLKRFRSILGEIVGQPGLEADGNQIAALRKLYGAVSDDMRATAEEAGPGALREFTRANSYFGARANRVRNTVSKILGDDNNATAGEAFGAVDSALKESAAGDAGFARRVLASLPEGDANTVRATVINRARGGDVFDPKQLAKVWPSISDRAKSVLLPQAGMREIMDDAASRAASAAHDPLEGKSAEQVYLALERAAESRGDSAGLARRMAALSPDEGQAVRALLVHRMGLANAGQQDAAGEAFSVAKFLTRWNTMTPEARTVLFGNGELRDNMTAVARLAERVKASEKLAGHSNTGAVNSFNATTGGLGGAALAFFTGHPLIAAGLAAPAAYQRVSAEVLTSPRLLKWLAKAPKKPNLQAQRSHVNALSSIARAEPAIAQDVLGLQSGLRQALGMAPARAAAEPNAKTGVVQGQNSQQQAPAEGAQQ